MRLYNLLTIEPLNNKDQILKLIEQKNDALKKAAFVVESVIMLSPLSREAREELRKYLEIIKDASDL